MTKLKTQPCRKKDYEKVNFDLKLSVIDEVKNGRISINKASKVYGISRSTITYWNQKMSSFAQNTKGMSKNEEIKKLKERVEALEFIKDFQQDIIADFENLTGELLSKKSLPETLVKEIEKKKRELSKQSGSMNVSE
jgi:transposase-like protein